MSMDFYPTIITNNSGDAFVSFLELERDGMILNVANGNAHAFCDYMGWKIEDGCMVPEEIDMAIMALSQADVNSGFSRYITTLMLICGYGKAKGATHLSCA